MRGRAPSSLFDTGGIPGLAVGAEVPRRRRASPRRVTAAPRASPTGFAAAAADEAVRDAGPSRAALRPAAVIVGGIGGGMLEAEGWFWRREREGSTTRAPNAAADHPALPRMPTSSRAATRRPAPRRPWSSRAARVARRSGLPPELIASGRGAPWRWRVAWTPMTRICFMGFNAPQAPRSGARAGRSRGTGGACRSARAPGFVVLEDEAARARAWRARLRGARRATG